MVRKVANLDFCRFEFCCGRESRICIRFLHTEEVSQFKNAVVASISRPDTPIRGRLALTIVVGALLPSFELYIPGQR